MKAKYMSKILVILSIIVKISCMTGCYKEKSDIITKETAGEQAEEEKISTYTEGMIYVYVTGAVKKPDVYKVEKDCRIYQIIDMAGGLSEDADVSAINMADKVYDGMKINVYRIGEETLAVIQDNTNYEKDSGSGMVNINTASKDVLMTLPGIGESKAESIIRYREENGNFEKIEDIMNISGIKEGAFRKIKDFITV